MTHEGGGREARGSRGAEKGAGEGGDWRGHGGEAQGRGWRGMRGRTAHSGARLTRCRGADAGPEPTEADGREDDDDDDDDEETRRGEGAADRAEELVARMADVRGALRRGQHARARTERRHWDREGCADGEEAHGEVAGMGLWHAAHGGA